MTGSRTDHLTVAVLGTGTMGAGMARNIAGAGMDVRVWNRTRERAEPLGDVATVADTPADAVAGADVVLTMLYDADSVVETMSGLEGALPEGAVWLQQATVGVAGSDRVCALAERLGVPLVDAPVLGTRKPAEDGTLVVLASGPEAVRERVRPVLEAVAARVMWVGEAGAGSRLKLAANAWVLTVVEGVAESLALTRDLGLDPRAFLEAVRGSAVDAPYVQAKGAAMLEGAFDPSFALDGALKDAGLVLAAAEQAGTRLGVLPGVRDRFEIASRAGHGRLDMSATYLAHRPAGEA